MIKEFRKTKQFRIFVLMISLVFLTFFNYHTLKFQILKNLATLIYTVYVDHITPMF